MKRTTVFADEDVLRKLREIAKWENSGVSEVTRKALTEYVSRRRARHPARVEKRGAGVVLMGTSGRMDTRARPDGWA
jgi:predicted transcriptional regulator